MASLIAANATCPLLLAPAGIVSASRRLDGRPAGFTGTPLLARASKQASVRQCRGLTVRAASSEESSSSTVEYVAAVGGVVASPVVLWSLYVLKTTGCGLPPGPGGSLGALEGVSYLAIVAIVGWSAYTKVKTGSGLPNGPFGLLGAAEGLAYLSLLASIVVFGLQIAEVGSLPGPVPTDQCFG